MRFLFYAHFGYIISIRIKKRDKMSNKYKNIENGIEKYRLEGVVTKEELKKIYPELKDKGGKSSYSFYEILDGVYIRVTYRMKNGDSLRDCMSFYIRDVDYDKFDIDYVYMRK